MIYLAGKPIEWWAALAGFFFLLVQIGYLSWKWWRDIRIESDRRAGLTNSTHDDE